MKTQEFDYQLPPDLIAQNPLKKRDQARLMVLNKKNQTIKAHHIHDLIDLLTENDVLVFNETKVFPARIHGTIEGKPIEILLHRKKTSNEWECLVKPGKKFQLKTKIDFHNLVGTVKKINSDGSRILKFDKQGSTLMKTIEQIGEIPLPPYIQNSEASPEQYQTIYAKEKGSVAAPTAGLHFTKELLKKLKEKGVEQHFITLHVGRGTFEPVKAEKIEEHTMHYEWLALTPETADALNKAKKSGKRIIAVGTTTVRTLESCSQNGTLISQKKDTNLFITPGYTYTFVDGMITNFHLPKSTLLMLISALAGKDFIFKAYKKAIQEKYRFYSFGDAMLIL